MDENSLLNDVEKAIILYEKANGYAAIRTRQMIKDRGAINALALLMGSPDLQQGFKVLRDANQLDKSFESIVVKYRDLFSPDVVDAAKWRLANPYDLL